MIIEFALASLIMEAQARFTPAGPRNTCPPGSTFISGCLAPSEPTPPQPTGCQGTQVPAGGDIQAAIDAASSGATLCLQSGLYRTDKPINPKQGMTVQGVGLTTIVSGAKVLGGFSASGQNFVATAFLVPNPPQQEASRCIQVGCTLREDVFRDGQPLFRVLSVGELGAGKYFADYPNNKVYVRDNPNGHTLEQSFSQHVFKGSNANITIKNLTAQMSATLEQNGAIDCQGSTGWVIESVEVRFGHGVGVQCDSFILRKSHVHHNFQLGFGGHGDGDVIEDNEINDNNIVPGTSIVVGQSKPNYADGWEGGGSKIAYNASNGVIRRNKVYRNMGVGLWCDINCYNFTFDSNHTYDNWAAGIFYEISGRCTITNNLSENNGWQHADQNGFYLQPDILVSASPNCEVAYNTVTGNRGIGGLQQNRSDTCFYGGTYGNETNGSPNYPDGTPVCANEPTLGKGNHTLSNLFVHHNTVTATVPASSLLAGVSQDINQMAVFESRNNRFENNTYRQATGNNFTWANRYTNEADWNAYGQH